MNIKASAASAAPAHFNPGCVLATAKNKVVPAANTRNARNSAPNFVRIEGEPLKMIVSSSICILGNTPYRVWRLSTDATHTEARQVLKLLKAVEATLRIRERIEE